MDTNTQYSNTSSVPLQSHSTNSFHKSSQQEQPVDQSADESFAPEEKFNVVEPSKLLEQTLTTDDLPRRGSRSSVQSNMELQRRSRSTDHSTALVPASMPSDALVVANQQPESPPDIKPELLDLEPPMSPVAGPSHSTDENSMMMYMDQSSMSGMPGPSGYQDNSALVSTDSQPQGKDKSQEAAGEEKTQEKEKDSKTSEKKHKCQTCSYSSEYRSNLRTHLKHHVEVRPFQCPYCSKAFIFNYRLQNHLRVHGKGKPEDEEKIRGAEKKHNCHLCSYSTKFKSNLKVHIKYHLGIKQYKCHHCPKAFVLRYQLQLHMRVHTKDEDRPKRLSCHSCSYTASNFKSMSEHLMNAHSIERPFKCLECPKTYKVKHHLKQHQRVHVKDKPDNSKLLLQCPCCPYTTCIKGNLIKHQISHSKERPFLCAECPKTYKYKSHLKMHYKENHGVEKTCIENPAEGEEKQKEKDCPEVIYQCEQCPYSTKVKGNFRHHIFFHSGLRPFKCDSCSKAFKTKQHLNGHVKTVHRGDKFQRNESPFLCERCPYMTHYLGNLKKHRLVHTGEKPFKCTMCPKAYKHSSHLKEHLRVHSGEKPFVCEKCGTEFMYKRQLYRHGKECDQSSSCIICGETFEDREALADHQATHLEGF